MRAWRLLPFLPVRPNSFAKLSSFVKNNAGPQEGELRVCLFASSCVISNVFSKKRKRKRKMDPAPRFMLPRLLFNVSKPVLGVLPAPPGRSAVLAVTHRRRRMHAHKHAYMTGRLPPPPLPRSGVGSAPLARSGRTCSPLQHLWGERNV